MTEPHPRQPDEAMLRHITAQRPGRPEGATRGVISDRYARFYAPLAIGSVVLAFLPLFDDVDITDNGTSMHSSYGTVFDMAGRRGGGPAMLGLLLLAVLVVLLSIAAFRARSTVLPISLAVVAALIALMLITKPGTGVPTPNLTQAGLAGLVLTICAGTIGVAHAIHLSVVGRRDV
jgi:hypothetical protein